MNTELSGRQLADGEQMCAKTNWVQVRREQTQKERPDYTRDCGRICIFFILVCNLKKFRLLPNTGKQKQKVLTVATAAVTFSPVPHPKQGISFRQRWEINKYIINILIRQCWLAGCRFAKAHPATQHGDTNYHPDNPPDLVSKCGEMQPLIWAACHGKHRHSWSSFKSPEVPA